MLFCSQRAESSTFVYLNLHVSKNVSPLEGWMERGNTYIFFRVSDLENFDKNFKPYWLETNTVQHAILLALLSINS